MLDTAAMLGPDGPLARRLDEFTARPQQQAMAEAVARTLAAGDRLVCEAGTGTGKTYAYLVPAMLHGGKVVISTGTRTLQDQLFHRDIPRVRSALAGTQRVAMLKGRANYLCLQRFEETARAAAGHGVRQTERLARVREWLQRTRSGEISEVSFIPEGDPLWHQLTSTTDNCLGQQCPAYGDCHVVKARQRAQEADLLVINHHLLFSDILLRQEGFGELLPDNASFIIDEAHQMADTASNFFGIAVGGRQVTELARDTVHALQALGGDMPWVEQCARRVERLCDEFHRALGHQQRQAAWTEALRRSEVEAAMTALGSGIAELDDMLEQIADRDKALENCRRRSQTLRGRLGLFSGEAATAREPDREQVRWFDSSRRSFVLRVTPMDFSATFRDAMDHYAGAWIFTSATLAVGSDFTHFTRRLGLDGAETACWDSPFDFAANALLYLPSGLPDPGAREYTAMAVAAMRPVLAASRGRAFVLFTSHRALQEAAGLFAADPGDWVVLVQGSMPHSELLERFRQVDNAVLLGAGSFWEGVDVRGPALSCVIIDKLPFAPPDDPVFRARAELIRQQGGNPFRDHQLPHAVVALKQGAGRLIRDADDRGVLMLCDPRLLSRPYGKTFLRNLPPMRRTRSVDEVAGFFAANDGATTLRAGEGG